MCRDFYGLNARVANLYATQIAITVHYIKYYRQKGLWNSFQHYKRKCQKGRYSGKTVQQNKKRPEHKAAPANALTIV